MERHERVAFTWCDDILFLAYYRTGGNKEDTAYAAGGDFRENPTDYTTLRKVLDNYFFGIDSGMWPIWNEFSNCSLVFLDITPGYAVADDFATILKAYFLENGVTTQLIAATDEPENQIIERWRKALGTTEAGHAGENRALTVMSASLKSHPAEQPDG